MTASVVDVATGEELLDRSAATGVTPASTNKVLTAVVNGSRVEVFSLDLSTVRNVAYEGQLVLDGIIVKRARTGPFSDPSGDVGGPIGTLRIDALTK